VTSPPLEPVTGRRAASLEELADAIRQLTADELRRLGRRGDQLVFGTRYASGLELLGEAVLRALIGASGSPRERLKGRVWRRGVGFAAFLTLTMKGLASDSRGSLPVRVELQMEALAGDDGAEVEAALPPELRHASVEDALVEREESEARLRQVDADARLIEQHFKHDGEVRAILEGEMAAWPPERVREEFGMTRRAYDAARTRMRRGVDKLMPGRRLK
jgi:hypothetical protein